MWPIWVAGSKHTRGSISQPRMEGDAITSPGSFLQWSLEEVMTPVPAALHRCFLPTRLEDTHAGVTVSSLAQEESMGVHGPTASDPQKRRTLPAERR